jgi:molybdate transport system substrate-binding protein
MRAPAGWTNQELFPLFLALALLITGVVCGCGNAGQAAKPEIMVFAGAGMRLPLNEIGRGFNEKYQVEVVYDYGGSGRLANKILAGQAGIFIPGGEKWAKILKKRGFLEDYSPLALHIPVIITRPADNRIKSFADFSDPNNRIVLGDAKACAIGLATTVILEKAGLAENELNLKARAITVKQLVHWIENGNADASIVWQADALQSNRVKIIEIPRSINYLEIIPVGWTAKAKPEVFLYIQYLLSAEGRAVFGQYGFTEVE